jgi:hypothetical protein
MTRTLTLAEIKRLLFIFEDIRIEAGNPLGDIDAAYVAERLRAALALVEGE